METSVFSCLANIFVDPKQTLTDIRSHTQWLWYPFVICILAAIGFNLWYFLTVDMDWFQQQALANMAHKYSAEQMEQVRQHMHFSRGRFVFGTIIATPIVFGIIYLLQAVYYLLVGKLIGSEAQSFGQWFNFTAWTSLPGVVASIGSAIAYLFSSGKAVSLYQLDVTSLNTLLFHIPPDSPWFSLVQYLHLTLFWTLGLMIYGFALWTRKSIGKSAVLVLTPYILIFAVVAIIKLA